MKTSIEPNHIIASTRLGIFVRLKSKPGKEKEVEKFLHESLAIIHKESATTIWFAIRLSESTFGIFEAFPHEEGRKSHLSGKVAKVLFEKASELLAQPPVVETFETLASKVQI